MNILRPAFAHATGSDEIHIAAPWNSFTAAKNRLASSLNTNPGVLGRLARKLNTSIQQRVAENRSTDSEALDFLAKHESNDVRSAVAQNENTPPSTAESLAGDLSCDVRYAMAENARTNKTLLGALAEDENPYVQERARRTQARLSAEDTLLARTQAW